MAQTFHEVMRRLANAEVERRHEQAIRDAAFLTVKAIGDITTLSVDSWEHSHDELFRPLAIQEGSRKAV